MSDHPAAQAKSEQSQDPNRKFNMQLAYMKAVHEFSISDDDIYNADETPLQIEGNPKQSYAARGSKDVR
jgi:hypothetical protein